METPPTRLVSRLLAVWLCALIVHRPLPAWGRPETLTPPSLRPRPVVVDGEEGDWFSASQSEEILRRLERAKKLEALSKAQDELIEKQRQTIRTATTALFYQGERIQIEKDRGDRLKMLSEEQAKALERADAWYKSPVLWTSVGMVVSAVVFFLVGSRASGTTIVER